MAGRVGSKRRRLTAIIFPSGLTLASPPVEVLCPSPRAFLPRCLSPGDDGDDDPLLRILRVVRDARAREDARVHLIDGESHLLARVREATTTDASTTLRLWRTRQVSRFLAALPPAAVESPSPARKRAIPKSVREVAWRRQFGGLGEAPCPVCRERTISMFAHEMAHVVAEARGGPTSPENLVPCCGSCNRSMGTRDLREFQREHFPSVKPVV